jgi:hypothetical protein
MNRLLALILWQNEHLFFIALINHFHMFHSLFARSISAFLSLGFLSLFFLPYHSVPSLPKPNKMATIAYYAGNGQNLDQYKWEQVTHVIYSFCHLRGQRLAVDNAQDSITIRNLVALKKKHKQLKVMLSLGGWGGCAPCSGVFAKAEGRQEFARSVKDLMREYGADGIDLEVKRRQPCLQCEARCQRRRSRCANFIELEV